MLRKRDLVAEVLVLQTSEGYFYYGNVSALIRNTGCDQLLAKKNEQNSKANVCINDFNKLTSREPFRQSNRLSEVAWLPEAPLVLQPFEWRSPDKTH